VLFHIKSGTKTLLLYTSAAFFPSILFFSSAMNQISLPDALQVTSWVPRNINPHYCEVKTEAERWIHALDVLEPKTQKAFDKCNFGEWLVSNFLRCLLIKPSSFTRCTRIS
jgi:hypothetical protein